jgi:hypothetical protein
LVEKAHSSAGKCQATSVVLRAEAGSGVKVLSKVKSTEVEEEHRGEGSGVESMGA